LPRLSLNMSKSDMAPSWYVRVSQMRSPSRERAASSRRTSYSQSCACFQKIRTKTVNATMMYANENTSHSATCAGQQSPAFRSPLTLRSYHDLGGLQHGAGFSELCAIGDKMKCSRSVEVHRVGREVRLLYVASQGGRALFRRGIRRTREKNWDI
jgi:hypothetical protein